MSRPNTFTPDPRHYKMQRGGGAIDAGADDVLESLRGALPAKRVQRSAPAPRVSRLEPRGFVQPDIIPEAFSALPPVLATIAAVAGLEAAMTLAEARGGTRIYVPATVHDGHWLVATLGRASADRLCALYRIVDADGSERGTVVELPLGGLGARADTWRQMADMIRSGHSNAQITMRLGVSRATVKRQRARLRAETDGVQLSLLDLFDAGAGRSLFDTFAQTIADELAAATALPAPKD